MRGGSRGGRGVVERGGISRWRGWVNGDIKVGRLGLEREAVRAGCGLGW